MGITVQNALELSSLKKAKLLGGNQGLSNIIRSVNVMEVPEIRKWLKGGELLITTGFSFKDDPNLRRRTIFDLAEQKVAAFGIKTGQYFQNVPEDMVEHANRVGLPLIQLDPEVPYMEIMVSLFEILLNEQLCCLKRTEEVHSKLLEALLKGNGLTSICQTLAGIENNPVLITDKNGKMLSSAVPDLLMSQLKEDWQNEILEYLKDFRIKLFSSNPHRCHRVVSQVGDSAQNIILVPIKINEDYSGNLVIIEKFRQLDELDLMAVEHASTIIALEFAKSKALLETECQIRGELLEDLIKGNIRCEEEIMRRANYLNFNLNTDLTIFVIGIEHFEDYYGKRDEKRILAIKSSIVQLVRSTFYNYPNGSMLLGKMDSITGLVRQSSKAEMEDLCDKLSEIAKKIKVLIPKIKLSIGVGRTCSSISNISKSYEEAVAAMRIGRFTKKSSCVTFYDELGPYRFLYELKDSMQMKYFYDEYLGKIIAYDKINNTDLLETLICYFKNDGSLSRTAKSLYIHKNSVIYRIKKIEEISGLNVNDSNDCFSLQLCLKLGQLVNDRIH